MNKNIFKTVILSLVLAVSACTKGPCEPPKEEETTCSNKGKFELVACGWGAYESYWIRLENGTLLQPCQSDVALLDINNIYDGMPIALSYFGVRNSSCSQNPAVCCFAALPQHEVVRITCIKVLGRPRCPDPKEDVTCNEMGVLHNLTGKLDGCGWVVDLNTGERLELLPGAIDEKQFDDNTPVIIGYKRVSRGSICMTGTTVDLTCIRVANTTQQ